MKRLILILTLLFSCIIYGADYKPITLSDDHNHDKFNTEPDDIIKTFRAYIVSFDGADDSDGDGDQEENDKLGEPEWVAYQINRIDVPLKKGPKRPSSWLTDKKLAKQTIAPKDNTYKHSGYDRGHMCMKQIAWRLGRNADWNTHTTLNACPQIHKFNAGIWLDMEKITQKWADKYGKVWVICGPVLIKGREVKYIGDEGEKKIPVPHAFFKIVIKENGENLDVLALLYTHKEIKKVNKKYRHSDFLTTVDTLERLTGLDFLTDLPDEKEDAVEKVKADRVWSY
jgi:endonuclease G, mitochondrial